MAAQFEVLGPVDYPHAAAPELSPDPVMRDDRACAEDARFLALVRLLPDGSLRRYLDCRCFQKPCGVLFQGQQRACFALQSLVTRAYLPEKGVALLGRELQGRMEYLIDLLPPVGIHRHSRRLVRDTTTTGRCCSRVSPSRVRLSALRRALRQ